MKDKFGRAYAAVADVKPGDYLEADGDFTCISKGAILKVFAGPFRVRSEGDLYIDCTDGKHFLAGQVEGKGKGAYFNGLYPVPVFGIGDLCRETGLTARTIRFYEDKGVLSPLRDGLRRRYTDANRQRLRAVIRLAGLGFTIAEVKDLIDAGKVKGDALRLSPAEVKTQITHMVGQHDKINKAIVDLHALLLETEEREAGGR